VSCLVSVIYELRVALLVHIIRRMNQINIGESNDEQGTRVPEWTSDLMLAWPDLLQNMAATSENPPASKEVLENLEEVTVEASPVRKTVAPGQGQ